jgi:hypothetical protein
MAFDMLLFASSVFRMQWRTPKKDFENERSIVPLCCREVGEGDCQEVTAIKSKPLVTPV